MVFWDSDLCVGLDGISISFLFLTLLIGTLMSSYVVSTTLTQECILWGSLGVLLVMLLLSFFLLDAMYFYIFFEILLLPFFILLNQGSYRKRRVLASFFLVMFTLLGSLFLLLLTCLWLVLVGIPFPIHYALCLTEHNIVWYASFLCIMSFAVKIPTVPLHTWLPEAHVEATTEGSVLLASLILKLSMYGLGRFWLLFSPMGVFFCSIYLIACAMCSLLLSGLVAIRQLDLKRIIAYSSISHMNLGLLAMYALHEFSVLGSYIMLIAHSFSSAGLFTTVGIVYQRVHTKVLSYLSGLSLQSNILSFSLFALTLANVSIPLTLNFAGEFLLLLGLLSCFMWFETFVVCFSIFLCLVYSFTLFTKICFGEVFCTIFIFEGSKSKGSVLSSVFLDCSRVEGLVLHCFTVSLFLLGAVVKLLHQLLKGPIYICNNAAIHSMQITNEDNILLLVFLLFSSLFFFQTWYGGSSSVIFRLSCLVFLMLSFLSLNITFIGLCLVATGVFLGFWDSICPEKREDSISFTDTLYVLASFILLSGSFEQMDSIVEFFLALELLSFLTLLFISSHNTLVYENVSILLKYFIFSGISGVCLFFGMSLPGGLGLNLESALSEHFLSLLGNIFILSGVAFKCYGFPFFSWVVELYSISEYYTISYMLMNLVLTFTLTCSFLHTINLSFTIFYLFFSGVLMLFYGSYLACTTNEIRKFLAGGSYMSSGYFSIILLVDDSDQLLIEFLGAYLGTVFCLLLHLSSYQTTFGTLTSLESFRGFYRKSPSYTYLLCSLFLLYSGYVPYELFFYKYTYLSGLIIYTGYTCTFLFLVPLLITFLYCLRAVRYCFADDIVMLDGSVQCSRSNRDVQIELLVVGVESVLFLEGLGLLGCLFF
jgi:NADH:ubiquinone oxidoreductase subunit 4 (subunit M)